MQKMPCFVTAVLLVTAALSPSGNVQGQTDVLKPIVDGPWWQVAGDPDLGEYTSPKQQPVDFGVWQALDGTWQLWSCIRHTKCGGNTRLFYRWDRDAGGCRTRDHLARRPVRHCRAHAYAKRNPHRAAKMGAVRRGIVRLARSDTV